MHMSVSAEWRERIKAYWLRRCFQTIYYYLFIFCLALPAACCSFLLAQSRNINASPSFSWMGPHMSTKNPYMWRLSVYLVQSNMFSFCVTPFLRAKTILQMIEETAVSEIQQCSPRGKKKRETRCCSFGAECHQVWLWSGLGAAQQQCCGRPCLAALDLYSLFPKQRVGITREPRMFLRLSFPSWFMITCIF